MAGNMLWAIVRSAIHIIPIIASIVLISLNGASWYIGGELTGTPGQDGQKLAALLFTAGLLDIIMLVSLVVILLTHIRRELIFGSGISVDVVFPDIQFKSLTFLWSRELWGVVYHEWEKRSKKWFIISILVLCSLLGLLVGPSTTVLMIPRMEEWPAGGTPYWINEAQDQLWPQSIHSSNKTSHCMVDDNDPSCPANGWRNLNDQYFSYWKNATTWSALPQTIQVAGKTSLRELHARTRDGHPGRDLIWANMFTLATIPPAFVADALEHLQRLWIVAAANSNIGHFKHRRDVFITTEVLQPIIYARCTGRRFDPNDSLLFPNLRNISLRNGPASGDDYSNNQLFLDDYLRVSDEKYTKSVKEGFGPGNQPSMFWIDDETYLSRTNSTLLAVATVPNSDEGQASWYCCSIDSRYAKTSLSTARSRVKIVSGEPNGFTARGTFNPTYRPIWPTAEWAQYLNPKLSATSETNDTVFSTMASTAGLWNTTASGELRNSDVIVENILVLLLANALSRIHYTADLAGVLREDWMPKMLPSNKRMGQGGNAFIVSEEEQKSSTKLEMNASILGYAYSSRGNTQVASMVIVFLYTLFAIAHVGWALITRGYSKRWASSSEMTVLALNSKRMETKAASDKTITVLD